MNRQVIKKAAASLVLLALPMLAQAQGAINVPSVGLPGSQNATIGSTIQSVIVGILLPLAGIIAVLFLIIGGFQFMFAGTNEELAKKGRATIRNAIIGIIIIILSYVVIQVISNTLNRSYVV